VIERREVLGGDDLVRQVGVALHVAPHLNGVVDDLLLGAGAVGLQHLAGIGVAKIGSIPEETLPAKRLIVPVGAMEVRSAFRSPCSAISACTSGSSRFTMGALAYSAASKSGKAPFSFAIRAEALIGGALAITAIQRRSARAASGRAVAQADHGERIRKPRHAQPDAPLGMGLPRLRLQREAAGVDDIVHHPDRRGDEIGQFVAASTSAPSANGSATSRARFTDPRRQAP
jgi:hypothetical protein